MEPPCRPSARRSESAQSQAFTPRFPWSAAHNGFELSRITSTALSELRHFTWSSHQGRDFIGIFLPRKTPMFEPVGVGCRVIRRHWPEPTRFTDKR